PRTVPPRRASRRRAARTARPRPRPPRPGCLPPPPRPPRTPARRAARRRGRPSARYRFREWSSQLRLDHLGHAVADLADFDLVQQLTEVAPDDQAPGLLIGDAPGHQVEQVDVFQPAVGAGVPGAEDLAGQD